MRRGFTLFELVVTLVAAFVIGILAYAATRPTRQTQPQMRDSTQIRGIAQSLATWASNNQGSFPLPSELDLTDDTVSAVGRAKDITGNIISVLIWNGFISPEICISPQESNTSSIQRDEDYQYEQPTAAVSPANALWDPAFSADFSGNGIGNNSHAYLQPSGTRGTGASGPSGRMKMWRDTFSANEAIVGNRAPEISAVHVKGSPTWAAAYSPVIKNPASETFLIHGGRSTWEGYVAYNDMSVRFQTSLKPPTNAATVPAYTSSAGLRLDTLHFDEPDDLNQSNIYLGIFITAGEKPSEFKGIWD